MDKQTLKEFADSLLNTQATKDEHGVYTFDDGSKGYYDNTGKWIVVESE